MTKFKIYSQLKPAGDQPLAIEKIVKSFKKGKRKVTLLGVTGSGKTFTIANVIEKIQKPTLVIAHNKTLAAQLASEFRQFFPKNAVEYFVSYYDYYQPEAYLPTSDVYIEKDLEINEEIDRLRHAATAVLLSRQDVIIVASVSCIYGLGSPEFYGQITLQLTKGEEFKREQILEKLVQMQYSRSGILKRGRFRIGGGVLEIMRPDKEVVIRIEIEENRMKKIREYDQISGEILVDDLKNVFIFPTKHFVAPEPILKEAFSQIEKELKERVEFFKKKGKIVEMERIRRRTEQDLELMREIGYCKGIENYSLYLSGRKKGEPPYTLIDYFPEDFLIVIDESHVTIPQLRAMYGGDFSRKKNLIDFGFRLPSAFDNRPLKFDEFEKKFDKVIFVSATPAEYEKKNSSVVVEQIVRPTGLVDPEIVVKGCKNQIKNIVIEIKKTIKRKERALITTLTKKMAENLAAFLKEEKEIKAEYLHSEIDTLDRIKILEDLRRGKINVLVGVNLLREGLDLPEVSLVGILDADKEGFLRSETSLIQTIGRAARNVRGRVILYADKKTRSMERAIEETQRRRKLQIVYNKKHNITPQTIKKKIRSIIDFETKPNEANLDEVFIRLENLEDVQKYLKQRQKEMKEAAKNLEFEKAALIRDEIAKIKRISLRK